MEVADLVVRIFEAVAWPVTIFGIILIFRRQFAMAVLSLSKLRFRGLEVEFDKSLKDAEDKARGLRLASPEDIKGIPEALVPTSAYERLLEVAVISPRAAVTEAWRTIEFCTMEAAKAHGIEVRGAIAGTRVIRKLVQREILEGGALGLYENLRKMRNKAAHAYEFEIDSEDAVRYVDLALSMANSLQMLFNKNKEKEH